ncbi:16S rRNA methyltransferase [Pueribacillus theae]|uniref:16S rRNA methyltransferase n=1 Tax=Pueribacillus theae TaxID=2171751 RepID=A0A2U1K625_9BACI|nr:class I SAM-dependent methyltransferase [Pueribacillus theae]PWA12991.1 16S rRNA methyltransferase [Pueribacillus theae]
MAEHYYSEKPSSKSNPTTLETTLRGNRMIFTTDDGVFSKSEIDFGTKLLIESFIFPEEEGTILDVGCGYGPIGLSLAKDNERRNVMLVDINERALSLAEKNRYANKIENATILKSNLFQQVPTDQYAAILSNPPIRAGKKVVYQLFRDAFDFLKENGELWIVIQKKQGAPSAKKELESLFGFVEIVDKAKGYMIFRSKKVDPSV